MRDFIGLIAVCTLLGVVSGVIIGWPWVMLTWPIGFAIGWFWDDIPND